jgi:hypothetical protein
VLRYGIYQVIALLWGAGRDGRVRGFGYGCPARPGGFWLGDIGFIVAGVQAVQYVLVWLSERLLGRRVVRER